MSEQAAPRRRVVVSRAIVLLALLVMPGTAGAARVAPPAEEGGAPSVAAAPLSNHTINPNTIGTPVSNGNHVSLALDANGNPIISFQDVNSRFLKLLRCGSPACTTGNSITTVDNSGNVGASNALRLNALGNPVIAYHDGSNHTLKLVRCGNSDCSAGNLFTTADPTSDPTAISLRLDASGNPVMSYEDNVNNDLKVLHCGNPTCTLGNKLATPDSTGRVGFFSSLALNASGNPVVAYLDASLGGLKVLVCDDPACTTGNIQVLAASPGANPLQLDASGNPVIAYFASVPPALKVLHCGNPTCTAGNTTAVPDATPFAGQHASLQLDASGNPVVLYEDGNGTLKLLHCGNPTCTASNTVAIASASTSILSSALALDTSGNPVVAWATGSASKDIKVLRCASPSCLPNTISAPDTAYNVGQYTSLALNTSGNPVVSYYNATARGLRLLLCGNHSCSIGRQIVAPDPAPDVGRYSSLRLDASGLPVVAYFDDANAALKVLHCGTADCAARNTIETPDVVSGENVSLELDTSGRPVVAYQDRSTGTLKVLRCGNPACSAGAGNSIVKPYTAASVGWNTSLVLDAADNPVISSFDAANADLKILRCGNPTCTTGNTFATPDSGGYVGSFTSLALSASGNPVVSYFGFGVGLKILTCGDPTCSTGNTITTPESSPSTGTHTSLALDVSGHPVVSYFDDANGDLKILTCGNATCTINNSTATVDIGGRVGKYTSLRLDAYGTPAVSYYDETNGDLKLLRCGTPSCQ